MMGTNHHGVPSSRLVQKLRNEVALAPGEFRIGNGLRAMLFPQGRQAGLEGIFRPTVGYHRWLHAREGMRRGHVPALVVFVLRNRKGHGLAELLVFQLLAALLGNPTAPVGGRAVAYRGYRRGSEWQR